MMATAIIQARMGSSRLPGKVLKTVNDIPLLLILIKRLQLVSNVDKIAVATTTSEKDDPIHNFCKEHSIPCYRGSEDNVLDRFYQTALWVKGDHLVRITGDCPFVSPKLCNSLIQFYLDNEYDYVNSGPTFAEGLDCEIFSFKALQDVWEHATDNIDKLHLTLYIHKNKDLFKTYTYNTESNDSKFRVTVDEESDFLLVRKIIENFGERIFEIEWDEIKQWLLDNDDVAKINEHIIRNEGLLIDIEKEKRKNHE